MFRCVIAGELPNEHEEIFSLYAIELKSEWPIEVSLRVTRARSDAFRKSTP